MSYWDTSTLVKLYVKEPDSIIFENHFRATSGPQMTSEIAFFEARATFCRKEADGLLPIGAVEILYNRLLQNVASGTIQITKLGTDLHREYGLILNLCYQQTPPLHLRTLDAIHLASAKAAGELEIVTTDKRMREAARQLGFAVFPV
jgi:uncharacterized protein